MNEYTCAPSQGARQVRHFGRLPRFLRSGFVAISRDLPILLCVLLLAAQLPAQDTFTGVERIVAVGDVHGDYSQFTTVLRQARLIDKKDRWIGGKSHLVQTGDVLDRGPDSRKVMDLLIALAPQAQKAGGHVHALTGNHETMNVFGDLRYVHPGEYAAFRSTKSRALQQRAFDVLSDSTLRNDADYKTTWFNEHPLGWVEHRLAFEANGKYAAWIRGNNAAVRINDWLFLHGGIGPQYVATPLRAINDGVRAALDPTRLPAQGNIAEDPEGPLWYRGLATGDEQELAAHVDSVLAAFGVKHIAVGHSVSPGTIFPRFAGKVVMIDVGLSAVYGGPPAALVIEGGLARTLHRGQLLDLPLGTDLLPYLKAAAALDPQPSKLQVVIDQLSLVKSPGAGGGGLHPRLTPSFNDAHP